MRRTGHAQRPAPHITRANRDIICRPAIVSGARHPAMDTAQQRTPTPAGAHHAMSRRAPPAAMGRVHIHTWPIAIMWNNTAIHKTIEYNSNPG